MGNSNNSRNIPDTQLSKKEEEYFYSIKKIMRRLYKDLDNNVNNINKAIERKYFDKIITLRNVQKNNNQKAKNITWKKYILNYLKTKENFESYYSYIINEIEHEIFLSENKYVSNAFFKEFELMTKPKILKDFDKKSINEKDSNDENVVKQLKNLTYNENIQTNNSKIILTNITTNLGGSFNSNNMSEFTISDKTLYEYNLIRKRIKEIIKIFNTHLENKDHPITIIISIFEKYFSNYLRRKKIVLKNNNYSGIQTFNKTIIEELHLFILKCQSTLKLMYSKSINLQCFSEEKDETINLVTNVLFQTGNLYNEIYELFSVELKQKIEDLSTKLQLVKNLTPKDLNIPEKFALDESTEKYKEELIQNKQLILSKKNGIKNKDNNIENDSLKNSISSLNIENEIQTNTKIAKTKNLNGYKSAIQLLKSLKHNKSPFNKIMIIALISKEITKCVDNYWEGMDNYISNSLLNINADQLIPIFIYIIINSQMPELLIHNKIINEFTTKTTKQSTIGYYLITLEAAIEYIQKDIFTEKKLYNQNNELVNKNKNIFDDNNDIIDTSK